MSALQEIIPVMLTQDVLTQMGVSRAAAMQDILGMESVVKVNHFFPVFPSNCKCSISDNLNESGQIPTLRAFYAYNFLLYTIHIKHRFICFRY